MNPLEELIYQNAPGATKGSRVLFATVNSINPLNITLDGDDDALEVEPSTTVDGIVAGDRVMCSLTNDELVVTGIVDGDIDYVETFTNGLSEKLTWRGAHQAGLAYRTGDVVTYDGGVHVATTDTALGPWAKEPPAEVELLPMPGNPGIGCNFRVKELVMLSDTSARMTWERTYNNRADMVDPTLISGCVVGQRANASIDLVTVIARVGTASGAIGATCTVEFSWLPGDGFVKVGSQGSGGITAFQGAWISVAGAGTVTAGGGTAWRQISPTTLDGLLDVSTEGATTGQAIVFDGTSWVPISVVPDTDVNLVATFEAGLI